MDGLPERFSLYAPNSPAVSARWWESFETPALSALVDEALTSSPTIQQAWARLAQANAVATMAGASRFPSLDVSASAANNRNMDARTSTESYSLGLNTSYEMDLWGRIESATEAAALDREATREQLHTVAITLATQTALRWTDIVAQTLQTTLLHQQIESNKTALELVELRFRKSQATALDVYQQRQALAAAEARIPMAQLREELLRNELAVLLGRADVQSLVVHDAKLPRISGIPHMGLPADVLAHRPDVREAGLRLRAADWRVSAARADRLPAIRLTASAEYNSAAFADLFDNWFANVAGSVVGPIFEGGRRKVEVERTRAVVDERLATYRSTVLNAMKDVEDALVSEQKQRDYIVALDRNLAASRSSHDEALHRYRNGLIDYLPVLVERVGLQTLERDRVAAQRDLLRHRINLYGALGGAWPRELKSPHEDSL